ncbi:leucine-rich repeat domain-containing protein [Mycetocola spongiae]|uniref:leucine-rich repeat domain-containing protein n=1 Tax=Mycetocola spongiae TaxID=2859226 RepID=UPI001CF11309|nr:leucine-rich repeat domain-containing protein [Mycetocola spongiae]UCR89584.1 leucine-rich repeat domain-containing protein [Mycetocola spongiae]
MKKPLSMIAAVALTAPLLAIFSLSTAQAAPGDRAVFGDSGLAGCVAGTLGLAGGDPIPLDDAAAITTLSCETASTLDGVEQLTALERINLNGSQVTTLSPLAPLARLSDVSVSRAPLASYASVSELPRLTSLDASYMPAGLSDLSLLSNATGLQSLQLRGNAISDLTPLAQLTDLEFLDLGVNRITDITPLGSLVNLTSYLNVSSNQITDLSPLTPLTSLTQLSFETNKVADLSPLGRMSGLVWLDARYNLITDLSPLVDATRMRTVELSNNLIEDPSPLGRLSFIEHLTLDGNRITSLASLAGITAPKYVRFTSQRWTLEDIQVGLMQDNPVVTIDGSAVPVTSTTADFDAAANAWSFAEVGTNTLRWSQDTGIGNYGVFSGTITQKSVERRLVSGLTIEKTAASADMGRVGDNVDYTFTVRNTGETELSAVSVTEDAFGGAGAAPAIACPADTTLAPGAELVCTGSYVVQQADIDAGELSNTASASALDPSAARVDATPSTAVVRSTEAASLSFLKEADVASVSAPDDLIGYRFTVTNTGLVTVRNIAVMETEFSGDAAGLTLDCPATTTLAPGESLSCEATYAVRATDLTAALISNSAAAEAVTARGTALHTPVSTVDVAVDVVAPTSAPTLPPTITDPAPAPGTGSVPGEAGGALVTTGAGNVLPWAVSALMLLGLGGVLLLRKRRAGTEG